MDKHGVSAFGSRLAVAITSVIVTTVVVAGGIAVASVANNSVNSAKIADNSVQSVDIKNGTIAPPDLSAALQPRWAKVGLTMTPDVTLLQDRGVTSIGRFTAGVYLIQLPVSVTDCGYTATFYDNGDANMAATQIATEQSSETSVNVRTYNAAHVATDPNPGDGFTVQILC